MKKALSLVLALIFVFAVLVGCGGNNKETETTTKKETPVSGDDSTAEVTTAEKPPFYTDLDYDGLDVIIASRGGNYEQYVVGEEGGDVVWSEIYDTNMIICDTININRQVIFGSTSQGEFAAQAVAESMTDNVYDIILLDQYYGLPMTSTGKFTNILGIDDESNYIDLESEYWYNDYMDNTTASKNYLFCLAGDCSPTILAWSSCSFVNWNLYNDTFNDIEDFLKLVDEGKWTIDLEREKIAAVYQDLNQNNRVDKTDLVGCVTTLGQSTMYAAIAAGMQFAEITGEGEVTVCVDKERNYTVFEKICDLYANTQGFLLYDSGPLNKEMFADNRSLFLNEYLIYAFNQELREMADPYVILPRPKTDESQAKYLSSMQDSFFLYTVPVTVPTDKLGCITATIELTNELYGKRVIPALYNTALKVKFVADEIDVDLAGKLIDYVRSGITTDFAQVYNGTLGFAQNVGSLARMKGAKWASGMVAQQPTFQKRVNQLLEKFSYLGGE